MVAPCWIPLAPRGVPEASWGALGKPRWFLLAVLEAVSAVIYPFIWASVLHPLGGPRGRSFFPHEVHRFLAGVRFHVGTCTLINKCVCIFANNDSVSFIIQWWEIPDRTGFFGPARFFKPGPVFRKGPDRTGPVFWKPIVFLDRTGPDRFFWWGTFWWGT